MFFVYIIQNPQGLLYKGFTTDIEKRLSYHNNNLGNWTKCKGPWKLVYYECFEDKSIALKREKFFKSGVGRGYIKRLLKDFESCESS
jgi:putative endonuclease